MHNGYGKREAPILYLADSMPCSMVQLTSSSLPPTWPRLYCRSWNDMNLDTHTCGAQLQLGACGIANCGCHTGTLVVLALASWVAACEQRRRWSLHLLDEVRVADDNDGNSPEEHPVDWSICCGKLRQRHMHASLDLFETKPRSMRWQERAVEHRRCIRACLDGSMSDKVSR